MGAAPLMLCSAALAASIAARQDAGMFAEPPEELTEAQVVEIGAELRALRDELSAAFTDGAEHAKPVDLDSPIGRVSRIDAIQMQQMAKESQYRLRDRLIAVKAAIERLEDDDYGFCIVCDDPIGYARLKVAPESVACIRCKTLRERDG